MRRYFTPHKPKQKSLAVLSGKEKSVRIDSRTIILVDESIPDDIARQRYFERHNITPRPEIEYPLAPKECFQIDNVGSLEDMEKSLVDEEKLPEEDE